MKGWITRRQRTRFDHKRVYLYDTIQIPITPEINDKVFKIDDISELSTDIDHDLYYIGQQSLLLDIFIKSFNLKPAIIGLWQISGDRSLPIHENIDHDLFYIENQSLLLDIIIILQTIWFGLVRGVGAK